ncbi:MAG TPA: TIGR03435 family protein [Bryobacteraceae bacterium]|jgi:uncharacterized protein (TIGR03435 family)|nr:TIGR03435 family protein [Bryobacteraceae bacterium]
MRIDSRELLAVGVLGNKSRIGDRIEILLRRGRTFSSRASIRDVVVSATALTGLMLAGSLAPRWIAFAQDARPRFEVASVKPGDHDRRIAIQIRGSEFLATNAPVVSLIGFAYGVQLHQIAGAPLSGADQWIDTERFTIEAKPDAAAPENADQMRLMVQSLLADRFKLTLHRETRQQQVYELVTAKTGPKLTEATPADLNGQVGLWGAGQGGIVGTAVSIADLVNHLTQRLDHSVIDKTGLSGKYDFRLNYVPEPSQGDLILFGPPPPGATLSGATPPADSGPSIFTALQEQLGLRLESARGPVEVLVIDHAEKPDAN